MERRKTRAAFRDALMPTIVGCFGTLLTAEVGEAPYIQHRHYRRRSYIALVR